MHIILVALLAPPSPLRAAAIRRTTLPIMLSSILKYVKDSLPSHHFSLHTMSTTGQWSGIMRGVELPEVCQVDCF